MTLDLRQKIFSLIDLTDLSDTVNSENIKSLCHTAIRPFGHVAAVCIYPAFVQQAAKALANTPVKIATVVNFPHATDSIDTVVSAINKAVQDGAHEIDVVFPYLKYLTGEKRVAQNFIRACKETCGTSILLKVILETGILQDLEIIKNASEDMLIAGADFLKTSTGKVAVGATLEAAEVMLFTIKSMSIKLSRPLGLKVSGGIRTKETAVQYIELAEKIMGYEWVNPQHFRIGASQLVDQL